MRSSQLSSQFFYLSPDRTERTKSVLLCGKAVRMGTVSSVDWLLEPDRKILVKVRLLGPFLTGPEAARLCRSNSVARRRSPEKHHHKRTTPTNDLFTQHILYFAIVSEE